MSFKLLAIRPLKGCSARFLKNLEEDRIYKFYNDYSFLDENNQEIEGGDKKVSKIECNNTVPEKFYEKSGLDIQISALVGKNGSGKSSLLELLYASCSAIAINQKIIGNKNVDVEGLKVAIFYNIGNNYYDIEITNSEVKCYNINDETKTTKKNDEILKDFFYTIAVNYSLYGLNEKVLGNWIAALFHKNDGYQTPLVINPYRREGNIDVNSELHLAQTRLITNILLTNNKKVLSGKEIDSVCFELDSKKYKDKKEKENIIVESSKATFEEIYEKLYEENYILEEGKEKENPHFEDLMNYILCKIKKISEVYKEYKGIPPFKGNEISTIFLEKLADDKSHITLKLRQVLNIIRFNLLGGDNDSKWEKKEDGVLHFKLKIDDLMKRIREVNAPNLKKDELIPIGCYRFVVNVKNDTNNNNSVSNINVLSSGEQHLVHTMQSVLYHILNVNSVHNSTSKNTKYKYINIVFDEIELYFHPEYQRRFVFELLERLDSLKKGGNIDNIKGVNILFCTHSPFILSDIPKQNVLFLGHKKDFKTFGANITTLLANSFFMENLIGEFAKNKINEVITWITQDKEDILKTIRLIDEPILKNKLIEMYYEKFTDKEREKSEEKIKALAEQLGIEIEIKQNK